MSDRAGDLPTPTAAKLPRWRGFNLLGLFWQGPNAEGRFREEDFDLMAEWGFNFARLPLSYRFWSSPDDLYRIDERPLREIDKAIEMGRQRGIHVNINFHRIPGYCINGQDLEPALLWKDEEMQKAACHHWAVFAERYKGIANEQVTFDLINEPSNVDHDGYVRVHKRLIDAIRAVDPDRLIITDGNQGGHEPIPGMAGLGVAMSTRFYHPFPLTHYNAQWVPGSDAWPTPTWPMTVTQNGKSITWDKEQLRAHRIKPWKEMEARGIGVHVGEWGAHNRTPHDAVLKWMKDSLELMQEADWGWSLWNIRGSFGVMDSQRADVDYEDFRGHKLDRKMLELLRQY